MRVVCRVPLDFFRTNEVDKRVFERAVKHQLDKADIYLFGDIVEITGYTRSPGRPDCAYVIEVPTLYGPMVKLACAPHPSEMATRYPWDIDPSGRPKRVSKPAGNNPVLLLL